MPTPQIASPLHYLFALLFVLILLPGCTQKPRNIQATPSVQNALRVAPQVAGDENWDAQFASLGTDGSVSAIAVSGRDVYVGGFFDTAGKVSASRIAKWDGSRWSALGSGVNGFVHAIAVNGNNVYVGGEFTVAGEVKAVCIAKWDGSRWSALGSGVNGFVHAIAVNGNNVYASGSFDTASGVSVNGIAKWDGSRWSALGSGTIDGHVNAIAVSGNNVYMGGIFETIGGVRAKSIAKWDGGRWSALGSGVTAFVDVDFHGIVNAIAISGNNVYVGGAFGAAGGVRAESVARWDGSRWSALEGEMNKGLVIAIAVDGSNVYVGWADLNYKVKTGHIAAWDGSRWSALGSGVNNKVDAIAVSGRYVYVGGEFTVAGGEPAANFTRYLMPRV